MSYMKNLFFDVQEMLEAGCHSWESIAAECGCSIDDVEAVYFRLCEEDNNVETIR